MRMDASNSPSNPALRGSIVTIYATDGVTGVQASRMVRSLCGLRAGGLDALGVLDKHSNRPWLRHENDVAAL